MNPHLTYYVEIPDYALNPYNDSSYFYESAGWLETPWHEGSIIEADKDFESVSIQGDNLSANTPVLCYWKDDASTDWELLGTFTADGQEIRWSDSTTRPATKRLKLGLLLKTNSASSTPKVEAIVVKLHTMIADRWRWNLSIALSASQEMLDGTRNTYTVAQMTSHLDGLITQTPPCIFYDVDGTAYEVKVLSASERLMEEVEYYNGSKQLKKVYDITLEQVTDSVYTPPA